MIKTDKTFAAIEHGIEQTKAELKTEGVSIIHSISAGTAIVKGLAKAQMEELLEFPNGVWGMVQTLAKDAVGVVFLDSPDSLKAGDRVRRSGRVLDVPVGEGLLGRVINPLGKPLDGKGPIAYS